MAALLYNMYLQKKRIIELSFKTFLELKYCIRLQSV